MRTARRMVFVAPGRPVECRQVPVGPPPPGAVVVRTVLAGVCGTDAHRLDGDLAPLGHPVAFGHEGIGVVEELGEGVGSDWGAEPVEPGDVVYWSPGQGFCPHGTPPHEWPPPADVPSVASYQDYALISPSDVFFKIPDGTRPEAVIAFGCAMPTAIGGRARLGPIEAGQSIVVQGCGPVGLASTLLAALSPARDVIVIGAPDNRLDAARRLGATATIPLEGTSPDERAEQVRDLTDGRGADVVIEAAGRKPAFAEGMGLLADGGRFLMLGLYSGHGTVDLDPFRLNNRSQRIIGSLGAAGIADYRGVIRLAQRLDATHDLGGLVTHRFPMERTEEAIAAMRAGEAIKAVVVPSEPSG